MKARHIRAAIMAVAFLSWGAGLLGEVDVWQDLSALNKATTTTPMTTIMRCDHHTEWENSARALGVMSLGGSVGSGACNLKRECACVYVCVCQSDRGVQQHHWEQLGSSWCAKPRREGGGISQAVDDQCGCSIALELKAR